MDLELVASIDGFNAIEGDLRLTNGQLTLVDGVDAIAQHVRIRLRTHRSEWFLDTSIGVPYLDEVFRKGVDIKRLSSMFRDIVAGTPGVVSVDRFNVTHDRAARELVIEFEARTSTGETLRSEDYGVFTVGT